MNFKIISFSLRVIESLSIAFCQAVCNGRIGSLKIGELTIVLNGQVILFFLIKSVCLRFEKLQLPGILRGQRRRDREKKIKYNVIPHGKTLVPPYQIKGEENLLNPLLTEIL
jgi:hypothetical protein